MPLTRKWNVRHTGPSLFNVAEQVNIMENVIQAGVHGIISTMPDPTAFDAPVQRALDAGIPVIATNADAGPDNPRMAYVGQSDFSAGQTLARNLIGLIGTSGKIAIGIEDLGHTSLQQRLAGILDILDQTDIDYTILQTTADLTVGASMFETYLIGNADAKAIISVDANTQARRSYPQPRPRRQGHLRRLGPRANHPDNIVMASPPLPLTNNHMYKVSIL